MYCIAVVALFSIANALEPLTITGTTPPAIPCPYSLCDGKYDGNYELRSYPNYFLQCSNAIAYCQPCFPLHLVFVGRCNQCLYGKHDDCATTEKWYPATTYFCPDECPKRGYEFTGNINDPAQSKQYIACWKGMTVGCIACPYGLEFNEQWNACLYEGKYKTARHALGHESSSGGYGNGASTGGHGSSNNDGYGNGASRGRHGSSNNGGYGNGGHGSSSNGGYGNGASRGGHGSSNNGGYGNGASRGGHGSSNNGGYGNGASRGGHGSSNNGGYGNGGHGSSSNRGYGNGRDHSSNNGYNNGGSKSSHRTSQSHKGQKSW